MTAKYPAWQTVIRKAQADHEANVRAAQAAEKARTQRELDIILKAVFGVDSAADDPIWWPYQFRHITRAANGRDADDRPSLVNATSYTVDLIITRPASPDWPDHLNMTDELVRIVIGWVNDADWTPIRAAVAEAIDRLDAHFAEMEHAAQEWQNFVDSEDEPLPLPATTEEPALSPAEMVIEIIKRIMDERDQERNNEIPF